jgi:hypothetical protein
MVIDVKPQGSVSYDSFDAEGERCFREFETNKDQPLLLLKSADAYEKSTNPDGKKIAVLLRGLYHREKGVKETDHKKAAIELSKAVRLFTRVTGKDAIETKKVKLEYLKRELATHLKDEKPPKELFLQRAELFKELKDEKSYNGDMAIYYMFSMLELEPFDDNFLKFANLMLAHADKSGQEELSYKAKVLLHQAKSSIAPDPKTSLAELEEALIAIQKTTDHFGEEDTKARLLFMRGMLTVDKKKRTTLIQEAAVKWNELGNKKEAARVLDMAMSGTTATLLARRWESALLVNVDNNTLQRLMRNEQAMQALMNIEGFRSLNQDIETIINKSDSVEKVKLEANERKLSEKEKRELTKEEKEYKSLRKQIQEKLIKFATRVPVFMYLTDYRERSLKDVITQLEPGLFKKVTGLSVPDFELLVSLGVFNGALMNDAVYKFKRYEDASLRYTGIDRHEGEDIGLFDTVIKEKDYKQTFENA